MKNLLAGFIVVLVFFGVLAAAYFLFIKGKSGSSVTTETQVSPSPTQTLLGGDRDEHGCIPSAGYSWCEIKQKCLRTWEEPCEAEDTTEDTEEKEALAVKVKELLVEKHGDNAQTLTVTVSKLEGNYAQGGASEVGMGGGMWFAAKVNNVWKLVWDGNGIITCKDVAPYPDFPADMIPECFDETVNDLVKR